MFRLLAATSVLSWAALIAVANRPGWVPDICTASRDVRWTAHPDLATLAGSGGTSPAWLLLSWTLMLTAMMTPLLGTSLGHVARASLPRRRWRAPGLFLAGYLGVWLVAMAVLTVAVAGLSLLGGAQAGGPLGATIGLALLWQGSATKRRQLENCHATAPLPSSGLAAEWGSLRFGLARGANCVAACWALMAVPLAVTRGHLWLMALVWIPMLLERWAPCRPARRDAGLLAAGATMLAAWSLS